MNDNQIRIGGIGIALIGAIICGSNGVWGLIGAAVAMLGVSTYYEHKETPNK